MTFYEYIVLAMLSHAPEETPRMRELAARRLVLDPLTAEQVGQLREISNRIREAVEPGGKDPFRPRRVNHAQ